MRNFVVYQQFVDQLLVLHIQNTDDMINNIEITIKFKIFNKVRLKIIVKIVITKLTIVKMKNVLKQIRDDWPHLQD